ncbi:SGNH/GDSL hydrolase family protein [Rhodotorula paludigena]|uniref:SGNH/GDSL hydrolase family protein n=1 Tax=Rhodotorula paludigena TaxID=86838 RepID=UPI00317556D3
MTAHPPADHGEQVGPAPSSSSSHGAKPTLLMDQVVMFGDSITQGAWIPGGTGARLADAWQRKLDVINRGFSGYNTVMGLEVLRQFLPRSNEPVPKMAIFIVWFGANDAAVSPSPQSMTLEEFKANLRTILDLVRSPSSPHYSPHTQLVLLTPPPVDDAVRAADLGARVPARTPDREAARTEAFAKAVQEVGAEEGPDGKKVPVVDVWGRIMQKARDEEGGKLGRFLRDGLHLTPDGYQCVTAGISELLYGEYPHLYWENMEQVFPHWTHYIPPEKRF